MNRFVLSINVVEWTEISFYLVLMQLIQDSLYNCWLVSQLIDLFWLHVAFLRGGWGKNRDFMIIRLVNSNDLIGCGGDP